MLASTLIVVAVGATVPRPTATLFIGSLQAPGPTGMKICSKDKHRVVHISALVITHCTCLGVCK